MIKNAATGFSLPHFNRKVVLMEKEEYIQYYNTERYPQRRKAYYKRKKRQRNTIFIIASVVVIMLIVGVFAFLLLRNHNDIIKGTWVYDQYTQYEFDGKIDGCMCLEELHYEFTYTVKGDKLKMDFEDPSVHDCEYKFKIDGNSLILIGGEGTTGGTYNLKKK